MVAIKLELLLFLNILYVTDCKRRITDGRDVVAEKPYLVYLIKAPNSVKIYDEWLCGGALVSPVFIITSAACVTDVEYMYAVAGYKNYIKDQDVETDKCTSKYKKKIVYTCVPMKYRLNYEHTEEWSFIDIALVKIESKYDQTDTFKNDCSYFPAVIHINYIERFQNPGTDTLTYGWGHPEFWRKEGDNNNYNVGIVQFAASKIIDKTECKKKYELYGNMTEIIDQYMICTDGKGDFNDKGSLEVVTTKERLEGCANKKMLKSPGLVTVNDCDDNISTFDDVLIDRSSRRDVNINQTSNVFLQNENRTASNRTTGPSRKYGICQNDHGGPLVTWIGGREVLIGVASVFKVSDDLKCEGPYLFTSTQCNGLFLDCILGNSSSRDQRRALCNSPPIQRGYETVERIISWSHHPAGPADNERNMAKAERSGDRRELRNPRATQNLIRLSMLAKKAKDQWDTMLRQRRPIVSSN